MLLVIDVGNTQTAIGVYEGDKPRSHVARRHQPLTIPPTSCA